ncbi:hypothetical protein LguiA_014597 [Lonicera macranthoides]
MKVFSLEVVEPFADCWQKSKDGAFSFGSAMERIEGTSKQPMLGRHASIEKISGYKSMANARSQHRSNHKKGEAFTRRSTETAQLPLNARAELFPKRVMIELIECITSHLRLLCSLHNRNMHNHLDNTPGVCRLLRIYHWLLRVFQGWSGRNSGLSEIDE